ncbi:flagellar hook-associated protein FlgL [Alteromonas lipolytica]|uniref:Flagellar hook-associated protein 3 n=1 Tax=Alteromonas lipolytica TaxID=1856405 RepID=A0A1E8FFP7_9ALTE|nr:flagellar hook-associated protein FlgL [Alteromonas lipolytica]OFI34566.1 flagellar hook-associated protein 3 [Alteromonas lipolytica]GGF52141.1 flagellar hook-associated protein 3 [Alteromonas lipolytica]
MRISTNQLYDQNIRAIMDNQSGLADTQQQLATGKKINKPSDDPVGAAKVLRMTEELDSLKQFQRNNDLVTGSLTQQETILRNITDSVNRARVLTLQAGDGLLSDSDRKALASEIGQIKDEVFDLMNSQNAEGDYYFSGYQSEIQPFVLNGAGPGNAYTYQGDSGQNEVQLSNSVTIRSSASGQAIFDDVAARRNFSITGSSGISVDEALVAGQGDFDAFYRNNYDPLTPANNNYRITITAPNQLQIENVGTSTVVSTQSFAPGSPFTFAGIDFNLQGGVGNTLDFQLDAPEKKNLATTLYDLQQALDNEQIGDADYREALADALVGIDNGLEKISLEVSSIGARLNVAESVYETNLDLEVSTKEARSAIQDVDYAEASAEFAKQEAALTAALTTFPRISNLSLFNYIS